MRRLLLLWSLLVTIPALGAVAVSAAVARNAPSVLLVPYYTTVGGVWSAKSVSVYKIDAATGHLALAAGSPFAAGSEPTAAALTPDGRFAYVVNKQSGNVSAYKIDGRSGALTRAPGSPVGLADFVTEPTRIVVDPSGKHAYVVSNAGISGFSIDAASGALAPVPGSPFDADAIGDGFGTADIAIDPANRFAYVVNSNRHTISTYTIDAGGALQRAGSALDAGQNSNVTIDPKGKFAYVTGASACCINVYAIDARTGALTPSAHLNILESGLDNLGGFAIDPTGKFAYAVVHKYVAVGSRVYAYSIDGTTGALKQVDQKTVARAGSDPYGLTIDPTGAFAYVFNLGTPSTAIAIYGYRIGAGGRLTSLVRSPFTAAALTIDPVARWFNAGSCAAFAAVPESGPNSPPVAKRDSDLLLDRDATSPPGYFYDPKRRLALYYPFGDAGGTISVREAGEPPRGVPRRDLSRVRSASGIKLGSRAEAVVAALGKPKIVNACGQQGYFYVTPGGMPEVLGFTIRHGVVTGMSEERGG